MNRMNRIVIPIICFFIFISDVSEAQKITYSEIQSKDKSSMSFNIIGKVRDNYLIYKNPSGKHIISVYATNMKLIDQIELTDIPERVINMDCIRYANGAFLIFQHQKGSVVYCKALKIDAFGKKMNDIVLLDTAQIGYFTENTIYSAIHSEDRSKICLYRRRWKNDVFRLQAKITDTSLKVVDSFSFSKMENERKSNFSEISIDNRGNIIFVGEQREHQGDNVSELRFFHRVPQSKQMKMMDLDLQGNFLLGAVLKVDNRNNNYLINSFYLDEKEDIAKGLFSSAVNAENIELVRPAFLPFSEELINSLQSSDDSRAEYENFSSDQILLKKDGSFILISEDAYTMTGNTNNGWNRTSLWDRQQILNSTDNFLYNPFYFGYRPLSNFDGRSSTKFIYKDIVVIGVDSSLNLEWNAGIKKNQYDVDNDNSLSFSFFNAGGEIHFFFIDKDSEKDIVSHQAISSDGLNKRYPTLRGNELGYEFMPRFAKQVGARTMLIPYLYMSKIGFARIELND